MAIRDKMQKNVEPYLQPGERVQAIFGAQTTSQYFALISYWIIAKNAYRVVVATDRRILVCHAGRVSTTKVKDVIAELPRNTRIGPAKGLWYRCDSLGDRLYVHKRFHKDIAEADASLTSSQ